MNYDEYTQNKKLIELAEEYQKIYGHSALISLRRDWVWRDEFVTYLSECIE